MIFALDNTKKWKWIKLSAWFILFIFFTIQTWKEWKKYIASPTTTTTSYEFQQEFDLPHFIFCDRQGFKTTATNKLGRKEYYSNVFEVDVSVNSYFNQSDFRVIDLPTTYNGLCKVFKFDAKIKPLKYFSFLVNANRTHDLFFGRKDMELNFVSQDQLWTPSWFEIERTISIGIEMTTYEMGEAPYCKNTTTTEQSRCMSDILAQEIAMANFECIPVVYAGLLQNMTIPICENSTIATQLLTKVSCFKWSVIRMKKICRDAWKLS